MSGVVVWLTGLPSSGKTTLARRLLARLPGALLLDSDEVRAAIAPEMGYAAPERDAFYAALARLAALLAHQGRTVLVAATANRRAYRAAARELAPRFLEVYVDVPVAECARRDAKGLYARGLPGLPGTGAPYEAPERPDVRAQGGHDDAALDELARRLA